MAEPSPFSEENELEDSVEEELLALLALAFVQAPRIENFTRQSFQTVQDRFRSEVSRVMPFLYDISSTALQTGLDRTKRELSLGDILFDQTSPRLQAFVRQVFQDNIDEIMDTNERMWVKLQQVAQEKGWTDKQLFDAFKRYYGLTPNHLQTILNMEDAMRASGTSQASIERQVQSRIDRLVEWRIRLFANLVGTEVVEGSKEIAWTAAVNDGQLDPSQYVKLWVSVVDGNTTDVCLSSHLTTAEIGGVFPNGRPYPPAFPPLHSCRSSVRIVKRV
ncbi:MAG: hypothetical protein CMF22_10125 [Idiomarinaceae bacterium]|nr:hypothetical protein [Idiomarinaceae bacterium]MBG23798.1 hypothetical protein [Idiomarinaceae bacterium]|tara:strand:+ start:47455 stop:48282 length:828 start_codon:yes stop_codon:yes gene_type:complete